ncbi:hypothetical protein SDC9_141660 [bioreactor metagenome]|uniref:Uncharacterized protein n=1 Tax=bioreactor metagenome TaxID=1076179 RepID=A0A645DYA7_9ZZZZ
MNPSTFSILSDLFQMVLIGFLPSGIWSSTETSISPIVVIANVLGIGVAVIYNTFGLFPFSFSLCLCCTPKRCCSSVMTKPRSAKTTSSWISACVPMRICKSPAARRFNNSFLSFAFVLPVSRAIETSVYSNRLCKLR